MRGSTVAVDVEAVRLVVDHISVCTESVKYALRNGGSASVGAVETDLFALKRSCRDGNQVADITISSCREILGSSDIFSLSERNFFHLTV